MTHKNRIDLIDTVDGPREQIVLPGAERSARQAQAAREQHGGGMLRHKRTQKEPGPLFARSELNEPELPL